MLLTFLQPYSIISYMIIQTIQLFEKYADANENNQ
jgi:hypothetical protein